MLPGVLPSQLTRASCGRVWVLGLWRPDVPASQLVPPHSACCQPRPAARAPAGGGCSLGLLGPDVL
jgi:hypothetical protein